MGQVMDRVMDRAMDEATRPAAARGRGGPYSGAAGLVWYSMVTRHAPDCRRSAAWSQRQGNNQALSGSCMHMNQAQRRYGGTAGATLVALALLALTAAMPAAALEVGEQAPNWRLTDDGGAPVDLGEVTADGPVVMLFWATWCPYCKALMPHIQAVRDDYAARGVRFLALNVWEDGDARAFLDANHFDFELVPMAEAVADSYAVKGTPGLFVIDGAREVAYRRVKGTGERQAAEAVRASLDEALAAAAQRGE